MDERIMKKYQFVPRFLFFFAVYPVLALLASNPGNMINIFALRPPVITSVSGTGPWLQSDSDQSKIPNADYRSGQDKALYAGISPVNIFRVVLHTRLRADDISHDFPLPYSFNISKVSHPCQAH
jgi:hypothetical protein